jgi:hypothetical protein
LGTTATSCKLQASSFKLQASSFKLQAASFKFSRPPPAFPFLSCVFCASLRLIVFGHKKAQDTQKSLLQPRIFTGWHGYYFLFPFEACN